MNWLNRHRLRLYFRNSLWLLPTISVVLGLITVAALSRLERSLNLSTDISIETARGIMATVAGSLFTLMVLMTSAVLVAVQLASGQLTPRVIAIIYRNPFRKILLAFFAFTFTFSVGVLARIEDRVPVLTAYLAAYGFLISLALFLFFIDGMGKALRPSYILRLIALAGRDIIKTVYPHKLTPENSFPPEPMSVLEREPSRTITSVQDGVMLGFDFNGLVKLAERGDCLIELVPEVGNFVASGDALFRIYLNGDNIEENALRDSVAIGVERTLEQDPMFAFRIMVDIASRALSPAINDPTTANLAIDQIQHLLREVGLRYLAEGRATDMRGVTRLVYSTPNWEDFVHLATTEIRLYGRDSVQIMRRLRAMLENLIYNLPARREEVLNEQLRLLDISIKRVFLDIDDQNLAATADFQGLGGSREAHVVRKARRRQTV
jgi:uncharacterized membrane protein